jgi:hypothetical protein
MAMGKKDQIRQVADEVREFASPDYGDAWWNPNTGTVYWIAADYTTTEQMQEVERRFMEIPGVKHVQIEDESGGPTDWIKIADYGLQQGQTYNIIGVDGEGRPYRYDGTQEGLYIWTGANGDSFGLSDAQVGDLLEGNRIVPEGQTTGEPITSPEQFQHPDPWMDNEPGTMTFPPSWVRRSDVYEDDSGETGYRTEPTRYGQPYYMYNGKVDTWGGHNGAQVGFNLLNRDGDIIGTIVGIQSDEFLDVDQMYIESGYRNLQSFFTLWNALRAEALRMGLKPVAKEFTNARLLRLYQKYLTRNPDMSAPDQLIYYPKAINSLDPDSETQYEWPEGVSWTNPPRLNTIAKQILISSGVPTPEAEYVYKRATEMLDALQQLKEELEQAASPETAYDPDAYNTQNICALFGHCNAVAYVVQKQFGGDLLQGVINGDRHIWNRLPDGTEVDLTSDQYGGDGINPVLPTGRIVPTRKTVNPRFKQLEDRWMQMVNPTRLAAEMYEQIPIYEGSAYLDENGHEAQAVQGHEGLNILAENHLIGSIIWSESDSSDGPMIWVDSIWVDPNYRKSNVFRELITPVVQLREQGYTILAEFENKRLEEIFYRWIDSRASTRLGAFPAQEDWVTSSYYEFEVTSGWKDGEFYIHNGSLFNVDELRDWGMDVHADKIVNLRYNDQLAGSLLYQIHDDSVWLNEVYIRPEFRNSNAWMTFFRILAAYRLPIEGSFHNEGLGEMVERWNAKLDTQSQDMLYS